jgi:hypothetical protein
VLHTDSHQHVALTSTINGVGNFQQQWFFGNPGVLDREGVSNFYILMSSKNAVYFGKIKNTASEN